MSQDYAYDVLGVPYSYIWELPGGGPYGFDIPTSEILPVVTETWEGMKVMVRRAMTTKQVKPHEIST